MKGRLAGASDRFPCAFHSVAFPAAGNLDSAGASSSPFRFVMPNHKAATRGTRTSPIELIKRHLAGADDMRKSQGGNPRQLRAPMGQSHWLPEGVRANMAAPARRSFLGHAVRQLRRHFLLLSFP